MSTMPRKDVWETQAHTIIRVQVLVNFDVKYSKRRVVFLSQHGICRKLANLCVLIISPRVELEMTRKAYSAGKRSL